MDKQKKELSSEKANNQVIKNVEKSLTKKKTVPTTSIKKVTISLFGIDIDKKFRSFILCDNYEVN
jgi:hypothetical protein